MLLDEFCQVTGHEPKYATKLLAGAQPLEQLIVHCEAMGDTTGAAVLSA